MSPGRHAAARRSVLCSVAAFVKTQWRHWVGSRRSRPVRPPAAKLERLNPSRTKHGDTDSSAVANDCKIIPIAPFDSVDIALTQRSAAQTSLTWPRSRRWAGSASSLGGQNKETVIVGVATGSGKLCMPVRRRPARAPHPARAAAGAGVHRLRLAGTSPARHRTRQSGSAAPRING